MKELLNCCYELMEIELRAQHMVAYLGNTLS